MKHLSLLLFLFSSVSLLAQDNVVPNIIIAKVKESKADEFGAKPMNHASFSAISLSEVIRKYPHAVKPEPRQTDRHGNPFVDLTRTYKLTLAGNEDLFESIKKLEEPTRSNGLNRLLIQNLSQYPMIHRSGL